MRDMLNPLTHPLADDGSELDASFSVTKTPAGYALYYASRGGTIGTTSARNLHRSDF